MGCALDADEVISPCTLEGSSSNARVIELVLEVIKQRGLLMALERLLNTIEDDQRLSPAIFGFSLARVPAPQHWQVGGIPNCCN